MGVVGLTSEVTQRGALRTVSLSPIHPQQATGLTTSPTSIQEAQRENGWIEVGRKRRGKGDEKGKLDEFQHKQTSHEKNISSAAESCVRVDNGSDSPLIGKLVVDGHSLAYHVYDLSLAEGISFRQYAQDFITNLLCTGLLIDVVYFDGMDDASKLPTIIARREENIAAEQRVQHCLLQAIQTLTEQAGIDDVPVASSHAEELSTNAVLFSLFKFPSRNSGCALPPAVPASLAQVLVEKGVRVKCCAAEADGRVAARARMLSSSSSVPTYILSSDSDMLVYRTSPMMLCSLRLPFPSPFEAKVCSPEAALSSVSLSRPCLMPLLAVIAGNDRSKLLKSAHAARRALGVAGGKYGIGYVAQRFQQHARRNGERDPVDVLYSLIHRKQRQNEDYRAMETAMLGYQSASGSITTIHDIACGI